MITIKQDKPSPLRIEQNKPLISSIGKSKGVFQTSTKTWSDATVTWSSATNQWGGSDTVTEQLTAVLTIDNKS